MKNRDSWKRWNKKGDPHLMNRVQWGESEQEYIKKIFNTDWFGYGEHNKEFEEKLSGYTKIPYFNLTNSGSTAITTALSSLIHQGKLKRGDWVIHPITTFPTSISSAIRLGLIPVFIETKPNTYVVDEFQVEKAIDMHPKIKGMIFPHLLGNIPDMERITKSLDGRFLIEDCCDTLGGYYGEKHVGSFGDFAAFSFYGSHHITSAGVGGALGTKDPELNKIAKSIIFWGHDYKIHNVGKPEIDFLSRYACQTIGSDFQMSAVQAGFGLAQFEKLNEYVKNRAEQFKEMNSMFKDYNFFYLPVSDPKSKPSWFCYPLIVKESAPFSRRDFVNYLSDNKVETRPIMCGNLLREEPFKNIERITLDGGYFPIGDMVQEKGLFIPCWGMPKNQKKDYYRILEEFLEKQNKRFAK